MRYISETFQTPPFAGERFRDGRNVVVEYRELGEADLSDTCDLWYYGKDEDHCDGGRCVRFEYADMPPKFGYYVKIGKE